MTKLNRPKMSAVPWTSTSPLNLNASFLVRKLPGGHQLVTAFANVARYSKLQPSLMPDIDTTLRTIALWKYLIKTDLTRAFYQIHSMVFLCIPDQPWACLSQKRPWKNHMSQPCTGRPQRQK